MVVIVEVVAPDGLPPPGSPLTVEVRDTSLADAPAVTVARALSVVRGTGGTWVDTVEVEVPVAPLPPGCTVWVHIDTDGDGKVSAGDYLTTASHPVAAGGDETRVTVAVRVV